MLFIPQKGRLLVEHNVGAVGTITPGTAVTTSGTSSVKGSVAELIAVTSFETYWVKVMASSYGFGSTASGGALDIMIGGAGVEEVLIPDLLMGYSGGSNHDNAGPKTWDFPLYVPAGARLSAQAAGERLSTAFRVAIFLYGGNGYPGYPCGQKVTTYGMGTVPSGTVVTPGASGAQGAWTQIVASTNEDHFALVPSFQLLGDASATLRGYTLGIGIGAATEEEIAQSYLFHTTSVELMGGPLNGMPAFGNFPAASRLSARLSSNGTLDTGANVAIHAVS